ncbi:methyl-accepting chemotaxis protein [Rhizobacter sp. J219]|uniref:methyl-accepting chemotaxis protein n=1 Tax=Rhizobacter sp. J219 TaxID=2898430 RepID=UPI002151478F|nr:methyl-accepting chemotaxis protein [Rhizobacter sp. J219]MCR5886091.1 methyl-accepting chemotaxis protein [Rhizobacter sp. J219]
MTLRSRLVIGFVPLLLILAVNTLWAASLAAGSARYWIAAMGVAAVAFGIVLAWWLVRSVVAPVREALDAARQIMSGDLTLTCASTRRDEFGQLMQALDGLKDCLFKVVSEVRTGTTTVASTSSQINRDNTSLSERTTTQTDSLQQTAASMEEITATVKQNAGNAEQANKLVLEASGHAVKGGEVVNQVVTTMGSIKESSRRIADIIGVIDGIAFQTNILALNAAVEAARAGEQGRGFAVVAAEVRTLAQRSATAAKEIKSLIGDSVDKVETGSRLVDDAGRAMTEIVSSVKHVADLMQEMAGSSHEQSQGIQSVNQAIAEIDGMVQQNAKLVKDATQTAATLNEQAVGLLKSVAGYNLGTREHGSAEEAEALVKAGLAFFKAHGKDALLAEINKLGKGQFIDRDLYLMAINIDDYKFYAHGNNPRTLGAGPVSKDVDGKFFVKEMADLARSGGQAWVDYKWAHPVTNEIRLKSSYVERAGDLAVACGIYKS